MATLKSVGGAKVCFRRLKPCSHLTSGFVFFFDLYHQMQMLSMSTIICCHRTHSWKFDANANADIKSEQGLQLKKTRLCPQHMYIEPVLNTHASKCMVGKL